MNQYHSIEMGSFSSEEYGKKFSEELEGRTYMNFHVVNAPIGGQWLVSIESTEAESVEDLQGMINYFMMCKLAD